MSDAETDDDGDVHMCIRCRQSISGLDNYLLHRKSGCSKVKNSNSTVASVLHSHENVSTNGGRDPGVINPKRDSDSVHLLDVRSNSPVPFILGEGCDGGGGRLHADGKTSSSQVTNVLGSPASELREFSTRGQRPKYLTIPYISKALTEKYSSSSSSLNILEQSILLKSYSKVNATGHVKSKISFPTEKKLPRISPSIGPVDEGITECDIPISSHAVISTSSESVISCNQVSTEPFTRLYDPILNNEAAVSSFFKSFDTFHDQSKFHSMSESQILFQTKDNSATYDIDGPVFDQRYPDLYGSLNNPGTSNIDRPASISSRSKSFEAYPTAAASPKDSSLVERKNSDLAENVPDGISALQDVLKQHDFMSSLELSSVKQIHEKRKYAYDDEEDEEDDEDPNRPPSDHTGGKWRPGGDMAPESNVVGKWRPFSPNTGEERPEFKLDSETVVTNNDVSYSLRPVKCSRPPISTKGKWLPGNQPELALRSSFLCESCNASFRTKASYKRHMGSIVHARVANSLKSHVEHITEKPVRLKKLKARSFLKTTIANWKKKRPIPSSFSHISADAEAAPPVVKKVDALKNPEFVASNMEEEEPVSCDSNGEEDSRIGLRNVMPKMMCPVCRLSFGKAYLSNHFASLAHIHNELEFKRNMQGETSTYRNKIILENIETLIRSCHFLCQECKFYCNQREDMDSHLSTHEIKQQLESNLTIRFLCSACPDDNAMSQTELQRHMFTPSHILSAQDRILSAQKIVISTLRLFVCRQCSGRTFKYYRQYEDHKKKHHAQGSFKMSSRTPRLCPSCPFKGNSCRLVRQHMRSTHGTAGRYVCFLCGTIHQNNEEARLHRHSREHRLKSGRQDGGARHCRFCYLTFDSLEKLSNHLDSEHLGHCMPCVKCGYVTGLQADLKLHIKNCSGEIKIQQQQEEFQNKCDLCLFSNPLLAHVLVHSTYVHGETKDGRLECHLCKKTLKYSSLRSHMLCHTREFPHQCRLCCRSFPDPAWLSRHSQAAHDGLGCSSTKELCQHCGNTFSSRTNLYRHLKYSECSGPCTKPRRQPIKTRTSQRFLGGSIDVLDQHKIVCELCGVQLATAADMKTHIRSHREPQQVLHCPDCPYRSPNLAHLRRHLRLHAGVKPFRCPHCTYAANNQENLRRHLRSKKHIGKYLYECQYCTPDDTCSSDTCSRGPSSSDTCSRGTASSDTCSRGTASSDTCSRGTASSDTCSRGTASSDTCSRGTASRDSSSGTTSSTRPTATGADGSKRVSNVIGCNFSSSAMTKRTGDGHPALSTSVRRGDALQGRVEGHHGGGAVFKTNLAVEFRAHLQEFHADKFSTQSEVLRHVRSYYRPEDDILMVISS